MPSKTKPAIGSITWMDLTVKPAVKVRDFYKAVVGWKSSNVDMGGYSDFCMNQPADGKTVAGVCHSRGENANLPPQWLIYLNVANLKRSLAACRRRGGKIVCPVREMGGGKMAVIRDPAGLWLLYSSRGKVEGELRRHIRRRDGRAERRRALSYFFIKLCASSQSAKS